MRARVQMACAFAATVACCVTAEADQSAPIRLLYRADPACPGAEQLSDQIRARTPAARMAQPGETAWEFDLTIAVANERAEARLVVRDPAGRSSQRRLTGRDCAEIVEALGLILALTVDDRARTDPVSKLSPADQRQPEADFAPAATAAAPATQSQVHAPEPRWTFGGGAEGLLLFGIAPAALPAVGAFVETTRVGPGWVLPGVRISLRRAQAGGFDAVGGTAAFRLMVGALEVCPTWLGLHRSFGIRPCVYGQWGALRAAGSNTVDPQTVDRMWLSLGPAVRLEYLPVAGLALEARLAADFPLRRGRFIFWPDVFHEVAPVGAAASLGVATRFP